MEDACCGVYLRPNKQDYTKNSTTIHFDNTDVFRDFGWQMSQLTNVAFSGERNDQKAIEGLQVNFPAAVTETERRTYMETSQSGAHEYCKSIQIEKL